MQILIKRPNSVLGVKKIIEDKKKKQHKTPKGHIFDKISNLSIILVSAILAMYFLGIVSIPNIAHLH